MKKGFTKYQRFIALMLMLGFTLISTPREAIHELFAHHDSDEHCNPIKSENLSFEEVHTHCDFFKLKSGTVFLNSTSEKFFELSFIQAVLLVAEPLHTLIPSLSLPGRAPPVC